MAFGIDQVIATDDLTHRGLARELATFESMYASLSSQGRLIVVPGNHDCLGDDVSGRLMAGSRVQVSSHPGVYGVRVNSTAPHNRSWINGHGSLDDGDLDTIDVALDAAPAGVPVVIALHHDAGRLPGTPLWLDVPPPGTPPRTRSTGRTRSAPRRRGWPRPQRGCRT